MARLIILWVILGFCTCVNAQNDDSDLRRNVLPGEELTYAMNYGWFTIGRAEIYFDQEIWHLNGRPHYYIQCRVQTTGFFDFFTSTDICLESWIDTTSLRPATSYRQVFFGRKMDVRTDRYDYADSLTITTYVEDVDRHQVKKSSLADTLVLDLLSTYLNLRDKIYEHQPSDTTVVKIHFSNDIYPFGIVHSGAVEDGLLKYDFILAASDQYKKNNAAYVLGTKRGLVIPEQIVIELTLGRLRFELTDRKVPVK